LIGAPGGVSRNGCERKATMCVRRRKSTPTPGDQALLRCAVHEGRVLITIDSDLGLLVFHGGEPHTGIVRLPDVPADQRIALMAQLIERYETDLHHGAILTVGTKRVRVSRTLPNPP
jgi:predicted nuclease of predicted toxin-antitoxin system